MIPLRKHQIFYKQYQRLQVLNKHYYNNEYLWICTLLSFGDMDYVIHGYIYRIKKLRTRKQVSDYFINLFRYDDVWFNGTMFISDILFRKYASRLRFIINMYEP